MESGKLSAVFAVPPGASPTRLFRSLRAAGYLPDPPAQSRSEHLFFETQDGRLRKSGCRLALVRVGPLLTWRLSGVAGVVQAPCAAEPSSFALSPQTDGLPAPVRELAGDRLLLPLVRLKALTWEAGVQSPGGAALTLGFQRFTAAPPRADWPKGRWPLGVLTMQFISGAPEEALHLATYLRDRLGLTPASGDACQMALAAVGLPDPGAPLPDSLHLSAQDSLAAAARKVVAQQMLKIRANVQGALEDADPEYVHDLRVATRRLRSALRLFADVLGPGRAKSLRAETQWVGERLGRLRDLDVFLFNLKTQAERAGDPETGAVLIGELQAQRGAAHEALDAALTSRRFGTLIRRLDRLAASPPPRGPRGAHPMRVAWAGPALIWKAQRAVLRLGRSLAPDSPPTDLHRLRILFKRLRYACEFFRDAFTDPEAQADPLAEYLEAMVAFQDCLGEHQDAVVALTRIEALAKELLDRGRLEPAQLLRLGGLLQVQREIARDRRERLGKLWRRFDRRAVRRVPKDLGAHPVPSTNIEAPNAS